MKAPLEWPTMNTRDGSTGYRAAISSRTASRWATSSTPVRNQSQQASVPFQNRFPMRSRVPFGVARRNPALSACSFKRKYAAWVAPLAP